MKMLGWDFWRFSWGDIWLSDEWGWGLEESKAVRWHFSIGRIVISYWGKK
jgi:hypothetical protein